MQPSRVRLTMRTMMIAVAAVAVLLALERFLYRAAATARGSVADGDYRWAEVVTVWLFFNIALLFAALIGCRIFLAFIHLMILRLALKRPREADSHAMRLAESTWLPFQSAEVCDICEHLTLEEKGQLASHGVKSRRKIGIHFSLPLVIVACSFLYSGRVFFVLLGLFTIYAFIAEWRIIRGLQRRVRQTLCATEYAQARRYHPDTLRMFSFPWSRRAAAGDPPEFD
jgi:hypothetical protein